MRVLFVRPNKDIFGYRPIGLSLFAAIARKLGWETKLFDTTEIDFGFVGSKDSFEEARIFKPVDFSKYGLEKKKIDLKEHFIKVFKEYNPDTLAFSVLSDQYLIAAQISRIAKEINPEIPVIWGGVHPTLIPEQILKKYDVDFVCIGEGLDAFKDFLNALSEKTDLYHIPNIWAKKGELIIKNKIRAPKENLDELPYLDWDIFDKRHFYKPFSGRIYIGGDYMSNWGCPYNCTYCVNHFYHELYKDKGHFLIRRYSVQRTINELKYLKKKYNLEFLKFFDEDFLMRPQDNLEELSKAYKQEVNLPFAIETNPRSVSEEKVRLLKNMNCVSASLGVETGDMILRGKVLNRVDLENDIIKAFSLLKEAGIRTCSFNMLGLPFETRETYKRTIELNRKAGVQYPLVGFFYPFEGTKLREVSIKEGFFDPKDKTTMIYRNDKPALHFKNLSEEQLIEMKKVFVLYIKLPEIYESFIKRSETRDEIGGELRKKLLEIYDKTVWENDGWYIDDGLQDKYLKELNQILQTYVLAEMASSHEGDPLIAEFIIKGVAQAKADGILFQMMDLETYIIPLDQDYKDTESFYMNQENWAKLIEKADSLGLDVWANVYDLKSFEFSKDKKIRGFKLHSSNLENRDLVKELIKSKKEVLLSIGGMIEKEIKETLEFIYSIDKDAKLYLMYGLQNFPTDPKGVNLNFIKDLSKKFKIPWGYQDHSEPTSLTSTYLPILALVQGAKLVEKHITHDRSLKGQDYEAALNPDEFAEFVKNIRITDNLVQKKADEISPDELKYREYKTLIKLVAKKDIKIGDKFSRDNLTVMRAKKGEIGGKHFESLLGEGAKFAYKRFEPIKRDELLKIGIFITARLKSKRLPFKVIKPILGRPMIEWMIDRLKRCNIPIVMMTSTNPQDDPLIEIAKKNKIDYFRGREEDVLVRMRDCAKKFGIELVISVTADDPFKEPIFIEKMIERYFDTKFDFCEIEGLPNGCEFYAVSQEALEKVCEIKNDSDTEIWGPYFKEAGIFKCEIIKVLDPKIYRPQYRVTVDEKEDFELVTKICEIMSKEKEYFNVYDICKLLDENKDLVKINAHVQQREDPKIKIKKEGYFPS